MDKIYAALGIHKLKLFVSQLKAANSLSVDSQARNSSWTNDENIYSKLPFVSIYLAYDKRLLRFGTEYFHK